MDELHYGIDPGVSGAVAIVSNLDGQAGRAAVWDTPVAASGKNSYLVASMREILEQRVRLREGFKQHATLELAHAMPGQGVTSMFTFGMGYGIWIGLLGGLQIPYDIVTPQAWKKEMLAGRPKDKAAARVRAQELFPHLADQLVLVKHDGRADALLIAEYGRRIAS